MFGKWRQIQWSDKTCGEVSKTFAELCEFNKELCARFPLELDGRLSSNHLDFNKEDRNHQHQQQQQQQQAKQQRDDCKDQKEDFIKELPLVANYCRFCSTPLTHFDFSLILIFFLFKKSFLLFKASSPHYPKPFPSLSLCAHFSARRRRRQRSPRRPPPTPRRHTYRQTTTK